MTLLPAKDTNKGNYKAITDPLRTTHREGNLFSYTGNGKSEIEKPMDYDSYYDYSSYGREKQVLDNYTYLGGAKDTNKGSTKIGDYENTSNRTKRGYSGPAKKENVSLGTKAYNIHLRDADYQFKQADRRNVPKNTQQIPTSSNIGCNSSGGETNKIFSEHNYTDRLDPVLLNAFKSNPYTQKLDSL